jgi:hypothetical protein
MRKDYTKPTIAQVNLVPTEAVLHSCKTTTFSGPGNEADVCQTYGGFACFENGS